LSRKGGKGQSEAFAYLVSRERIRRSKHDLAGRTDRQKFPFMRNEGISPGRGRKKERRKKRSDRRDREDVSSIFR